VRLILAAALGALLAADWWWGSFLFDLTFHKGDSCETGYDCDQPVWVYWTQVVLMAGVLIGLFWATWRVWKRLHASFASRFARPS
jgi:hypothetical protein